MNSAVEEDVLAEYLVGFPLYKEEIFRAIADTQWQDFRLSLKGLSTERKLEKLRQWVKDHSTGSAEQIERSRIQVMNYINALKRGGQLSKDGQVVR